MTARRVLVWLLSLVGLAVLGADVSGAGAQSLPAAIYKGYAPNQPSLGSPSELTGPGTYSKTYNDLSNPAESYQYFVALAGVPGPYVSAGVQGDENQTFASGELFFYFEIVGPAGQTPVTLDLTASLTATSYGTGAAAATLQIEQVSGTGCSLAAPCTVAGADWGACSVSEAPGDCAGEPKPLPATTEETLYSNTIYQMELAASAAAPDPGLKYLIGGGTGIADSPFLAIDPSTPDATDYSLAFSAGIGNSAGTTVPEPSSWILLSVGFAGAGLLRLARKGSPKERPRGLHHFSA